MFRIVTHKRFGTRKTVEGTTLSALRDGIQDLRFDDHQLTMTATDEDGVSTFIMRIEVLPDPNEGVEFKIYNEEDKSIG